jgi:hypothetical protein
VTADIASGSSSSSFTSSSTDVSSDRDHFSIDILDGSETELTDNEPASVERPSTVSFNGSNCSQLLDLSVGCGVVAMKKQHEKSVDVKIANKRNTKKSGKVKSKAPKSVSKSAAKALKISPKRQSSKKVSLVLKALAIQNASKTLSRSAGASEPHEQEQNENSYKGSSKTKSKVSTSTPSTTKKEKQVSADISLNFSRLKTAYKVARLRGGEEGGINNNGDGIDNTSNANSKEKEQAISNKSADKAPRKIDVGKLKAGHLFSHQQIDLQTLDVGIEKTSNSSKPSRFRVVPRKSESNSL